MKVETLKQANQILIYGYGVEGKSTEQWLEKQGLTEKIVIHDDKIDKYASKKDLKKFDVIVVSAGIPRTNPSLAPSFKKRGRTVFTSNTELLFHNLSTENLKKCIGITGTKGKSMTAKLLFEMLQKAKKKVILAGNIGLGPLDVLEQIEDLDFVVLELSSFQLDGLDVSPKYALCTNLFEDHLDWHGTTQKYHGAKENLWKHQNKDGILFFPEVHRDSFLESSPQPPEVPCQSSPQPPRGLGGALKSCSTLPENIAPEGSLWNAKHYRENFGLVLELAKKLSISENIFKEALQNLEPLPHRVQTIGVIDGVTFIDNAISTNIYTTLADLTFFGDRIGTLMLGGKDRGQDFTSIFEYITEHSLPAKIIILESETAEKIEEQVKRFPEIRVFRSSDMKNAVELGKKHTPEEKVCLLSPAAASWDRYNNYHEKGEAFKKWVLKIPQI